MKKFGYNAIGIIMIAWAFLSTVYLATMGLDVMNAFLLIFVNSALVLLSLEWRYK